ncbi:MAG TPA: tetratricopeptide repeat protein [Vicinamibacterales bacterium]|nr:tetratricopeptide repeat protein [Vicinamibacterales bacterium]
MNAPRLISSLVLVALAIPSTAVAQRDSFLAAFVQFYETLRGAYGDEGPQLVAQLERMTTALAAWDRQIRDAESQLQPRLKDADVQTALEVHTILASLYLERGRFDEALREFEADIKIDPTRAAFHRYKGMIHQAIPRPANAADAFRATWLLDPADPQNIYRLLVYRSDSTTAPEIEKALASFSQIEGELIRLGRRAPSPFRTTQAIDDDAGGGMGFVPPTYARGFSLLQRGEYEQGLAALRAAVAADPLVADTVSRTEPMAQGIAALRQGLVDAAIDRFETAVARSADSSEAHRVLGTAYGIRGDVAKSVQHLRDAVRLNPRDERSWLTLASTLEDTGELAEAVTVLRSAIAMLPDSGALRSRLAGARRQATDESDLDLLSIADRLVLFAGKGELLGQMAAMAQAHLDYERAVKLLELRVALTPNNAAAHKALGRAYVDQSREEVGYAELVTALLLDPLDAETLTSLGRLHLAAGRAAQAVAALERALALDARNSQALNALGNALIRTGRTAEGQQRLEESVRWQALDLEDQRSKRTAAMLSVQAAIHVSKGEYDAAIDTWKQAITIRRDSVGPFQIADALIKAGRLEEASAVLQAAIPSNPRPEVHRRLAEVYAAIGRTEESARERRVYATQRLEELRRGG